MSSAIGIEKAITLNEDAQVAEALSRVLADTFTLYLKTHNFHWNVIGPNFHTLHLMFEEQYNELWLAGDAIAERIRALGCIAPGSYREFSKLSYLQETETVPSAKEMIAELLRDHRTCARTARWALSVSRTAVDAPTEDLLTQRVMAHEKAAWMLRSILAEDKPAMAPNLKLREH
ncbi:MAG TPA: DNA starvation/stationary phase protection protein [Pyrinomonadaceae bacterium]|nr:DNA starvation/stationary phase protection protein [Pyrinomonadaceae bacterium]